MLAKIEGGRLVREPKSAAEKEADAKRFADMCNSGIAPGYPGSERALLEGHVLNHGLDGMPTWMADQHVYLARKAGVNITGKVYKSSLADQRGPGDPEAWVSDAGDIMRVAKNRNLNVRGVVNHKGYKVPPPPPVELSESCIQELAPRYLAENPDLARKPEELREKIIQNHGPACRKRPRKFKHDPNLVPEEIEGD